MNQSYAERMAQNLAAREAHKAQLEAEHFLFTNLVSRAKLDMLYQIAYDYGHSNGWSEIAIYYANFVPLIK